MIHPFEQQRAEIEHLLSICRITRRAPVEEGCHVIVQRGLDVYRELADAVRPVPAVLLAALDLREGDCNPHTGIGQGDRWDRVSTHVPRGKGPFGSWLQANIFYVHYDHLDSVNGLVPPTWTWAFSVYKANAWNGFGPNNHGHYSGYPWSCTNIYDDPPSPPARGKYKTDGGGWDPGFLDPQAGTVPVMLELVKAYPDLAFAPLPTLVDTTAAPPAEPIAPTGFGGTEGEVEALQDHLNRLGEAGVFQLEAPLQLDGNFGRMTRKAIRLFQAAENLEADGVVGPKTEAALEEALKEVKS